MEEHEHSFLPQMNPISTRSEGNPFSEELSAIDIEDIIGGSEALNLHAAGAMWLGKARSVGLEYASNFFRSRYDETSDVQCLWLLTEAHIVDELSRITKEFPDATTRAWRFVSKIKKENPDALDEIRDAVLSQDWTLDRVKQQEKTVEVLDKILDEEDGK